MNVVELREALKRNHVPDRLYKLSGVTGNDDCHGLERKRKSNPIYLETWKA